MTSSISLSLNFNNNFFGTGFSDTVNKFSHNFDVKIHLKPDEEPKKEQEQEDKLNNQPEKEYEEEEQNEEESEEEDDEEFSFVCLNPDGSPISTDDLFEDGQIRSVLPLFNQDILFVDENGPEDGDVTLRSPVRKFFMEDSSDAVIYFL